MSEDETNRKLLKPDCNFSHVIKICEDLFMFSEHHLVELKSYESYDDQNFYLKLNRESGEWASNRLVLKIQNGVDSHNLPLLEAQNRLMLHLRRCGVRTTTPLKAPNGQRVSHYRLPTKSGTPCRLALRLLDYVPGRALCDYEVSERGGRRRVRRLPTHPLVGPPARRDLL
eukprot:CAMPEP_0194706988 /NCGR_PEP_ID=MMETSP0295-20121207/29890_1 /TAXON_ID=39354 /ORGANISM="Heterosigma akashiwo, Strain CCMP2393" /LENGTH=170 /DNA_ID=CAMNT_0039603037 /DNA_START=159 /DNA_END=667 /DNA_ORIENTATION=+